MTWPEAIYDSVITIAVAVVAVVFILGTTTELFDRIGERLFQKKGK